MKPVDYVRTDGARFTVRLPRFSCDWWLLAGYTILSRFISPPRVFEDGTALARENGRFVFREPGAPGNLRKRSGGAA